MIYRGPGFLRSYVSAPRPPLPPSPVSKLPLFLSPPVCCRSSLLKGEGGGGGRGAEAYDRKKALPSINHSILAAPLNWHLSSCMKQINHILFVTEYSISFSNANANGCKNVDTLFHYAEIIK